VWQLQSESEAYDEGRERYLDLTPEQREAALPDIMRSLRAWETAQDKAFARGWLDEKRRQER